MKAQNLVEILKSKNLTIGAVESMTGGLFASAVTDIPGASDVFCGSIVAYTPQVKCNLVNVRKETIDQFGVVSWEVASEMAYNGRTLLNVDYCIAVTGNAMQEDRELCLQAGMNDYLAKPINPDLLFAKLYKWLTAAQQH